MRLIQEIKLTTSLPPSHKVLLSKGGDYLGKKTILNGEKYYFSFFHKKYIHKSITTILI